MANTTWQDISRCHHSLDRRSFLKFLAAGSATMALGPMKAAWGRTAAGPAAGRTKSVILLWMAGGPSQLDTFDPKPGSKNQGEFAAIDTPVKGMRVAEVLPRVAAEAEHFSIVRTLTTGEASHDRATHLLHTGQEPIQGLEFAPAGTVVARENRTEDFPLPPFIAISPPAIPRSRIFGEELLPFTIENPANPVPNLESRVQGARAAARDALLRAQDDGFAKDRADAEVEKARAAAKRAHDMMTTPLLSAFDLKKEPEKVREEYGPGFGQKCLLARRLVEVGVPFVEVGLGGWDNHRNVNAAVRKNCDQLDRGMGALIGDLAASGLLEDTLVLWMGEFGRTPTINRTKGRDHWSRCFSVVMAGAGIEGGRVVGRTDRDGMDIADRPVTIDDLFTTIYEAVGVDPDTEYEVQSRPVTYGNYGRKIKELF
jgi:uncharacterized protein (DUF1501 family)